MSNVTNYNEVSKSYDSGRKAADAHVIKSLMENFTGKEVRDMDLVDIGCGTGNYSEYFMQFEPRSLTLFDASEGMLNKAKGKVTTSASSKTKLSFHQVVLPDMPFQDNSFDAGMINLVLHHLEVNPDGKSFPNVSKTLKEAYRVLKPGGVLTIITETPETIDGTWFGQLVPQTCKRWHKRFPSHTQMTTMFKEAGFSLKSALKSLMPSYLPGYGHLDGPLHESWRNNNSFWVQFRMSNVTDYNEVSKSYDTGRKAADAHVIKSLMEHFTGKDVKDMDLVDIGCGTGNYSEYFMQFEPNSLTLFDASEGMLNKAKGKVTTSASSKTKLSFHHVVLPDMPFPENSFDAGMINLVLHHLEENPDGKSFPNAAKALKEAFRVLRPGGVLTITTETPENLEGNWFAHLVPEATKRWYKRLPTHAHIKNMLEDAGFSMKSSYKTLMASYFPDQRDLEGPLHESWRNLNSFWAICTQSEIQDMVEKVTQMKNENSLREFFQKHDKTYSVGALEIFAAQK
uniref:Menaquinone biosynthesis methyltransferase ubiE n=1 Tax=Magallana gigas TaxID=29159 RepID=K1QNA6_MAGGI